MSLWRTQKVDGYKLWAYQDMNTYAKKLTQNIVAKKDLLIKELEFSFLVQKRNEYGVTTTRFFWFVSFRLPQKLFFINRERTKM